MVQSRVQSMVQYSPEFRYCRDPEESEGVRMGGREGGGREGERREGGREEGGRENGEQKCKCVLRTYENKFPVTLQGTCWLLYCDLAIDNCESKLLDLGYLLEHYDTGGHQGSTLCETEYYEG